MGRHDHTRHFDKMPRSYGLREFTDFLVDAAQNGAVSEKLVQRDRARLSVQADLLSRAVAELTKILTDHQTSRVQKSHLAILYQALGSACTIASYQVENPAVKREMRERAAYATRERKAQSQKIDDVLFAVLSAWCSHPGREWAMAPENSWRVVDVILETLNKQLKRKKPLKRDAVHRRLVPLLAKLREP
jgi:hypothetical protein